MSEFRTVIDGFKANSDAVYELLEFDGLVLDHVVGGLDGLADALEAQGKRQASTTVRNRVAALRNTRKNESLRPRYATIFNQCVVLLVSYFGSAVHSLFTLGVAKGLHEGHNIPAAGQDVKFLWRELSLKEVPLEEAFADLLVAQKDISFQDMQSISRAFDAHLGIPLEQDAVTNDIILGQACRHVIVHAGGVVDTKMARQVARACPRLLKPTIQVGQVIQFEIEEVRQLGARMGEYLDRLVTLAEARLPSSAGPISG